MIDEFFLARYPGDGSEQKKVREFLLPLCKRHIELGLADSNFESNLCSGEEPRYWQRLSEALLAYELIGRRARRKAIEKRTGLPRHARRSKNLGRGDLPRASKYS